MPRIATKQINFRVTDEELAVLEMNAGRAGLKIPTFCKNAALAVKVRPQVIEKELGQAMLPHISHMGSNLNQLAKRANEGGTVAAAELAEVKPSLKSYGIWCFTAKSRNPTRQRKKSWRRPQGRQFCRNASPKPALYAAALPSASTPTSRTRII